MASDKGKDPEFEKAKSNASFVFDLGMQVMKVVGAHGGSMGDARHLLNDDRRHTPMARLLMAPDPAFVGMQMVEAMETRPVTLPACPAWPHGFSEYDALRCGGYDDATRRLFIAMSPYGKEIVERDEPVETTATFVRLKDKVWADDKIVAWCRANGYRHQPTLIDELTVGAMDLGFGDRRVITRPFACSAGRMRVLALHGNRRVTFEDCQRHHPGAPWLLLFPA